MPNAIKKKYLKRTIQYYLFGLTFCFCHLNLLAQNKNIHSLQNLILKDKPDTNKVKHLNQLSWEYTKVGEYDDGLKYGNKALALARSLSETYSDERGRTARGSAKGIAHAYNNIGLVYWSRGNYKEALKNYFTSLNLSQRCGDKKGIANAYNNIGLVYWNQGNYNEAIKNYFASLKNNQEIGNKLNIATTYNNIGVIYFDKGNYPEALKNHFVSLKIKEEIGDKRGVASSYNSIGNIYQLQNNNKEALKQFLASLKIGQEVGDKQGIATSYNSIGQIYCSQGNYAEALENFFISLKISQKIGDKQGTANTYMSSGFVYEYQKNYGEALKNDYASLKIKEEIGEKPGIAQSLISIGRLQIKLKQTKEAKKYLIKALQLSKDINNPSFIKEAYMGLAILDSVQGNWKTAYENYKLFIICRDSIDNQKTKKKTIERAMTYEFEKKEIAAKVLQDKKDVLTAEEKQRQRVILVIVSFFLAFIALLAVFIFRGYRLKQKANIIITQQKTEVEKQKELVEKKNKMVEEKNKEITDSINYAKRIQQAKLPKKEEIYFALPQCFVLFKPKDIVSGDFYFFHKNEQSVFIAAADCTGHGVPGAFMSLIGSEKLEDAVSQTADTSEILKRLNRGIKTSLHQSEINESTRDGMDIALCFVDTVSRNIKYAGANRPLWIIRNGQTNVEEIKATKTAIGGLTEKTQHFDTHELKLQQGDTFYICTDGYADQFGGQTGKKLMTKKFKKILLEVQGKTMKEQEKHLDNFIENWKAGREQVDDILVIGVRL